MKIFRLHCRLSKQDTSFLDAISHAYHLSRSAMIRQLIRSAAAKQARKVQHNFKKGSVE